MKTKTQRNNVAAPQFRTVNGRRVVILDQAEYERLRERADEWEPLLPKPNADGNYPALEYGISSLALKLVRHRRRARLTQADLARRGAIRPEPLHRTDPGPTTPSLAT